MFWKKKMHVDSPFLASVFYQNCVFIISKHGWENSLSFRKGGLSKHNPHMDKNCARLLKSTQFMSYLRRCEAQLRQNGRRTVGRSSLFSFPPPNNLFQS